MVHSPAMSDQSNPWTTHETRMVYENAWIRVEENRVMRPDGAPGIYGVVHARVATGVVAMDDNGDIVLVGQYRYPTQMYSWEVPEGGTDEGESALEAIQRELEEEAGVTARDWVQLGGEIHLTNCHSSEIGYVYLATGLSPGQQQPDGTEVLQIRKVSMAKALEMVDTGEIVDAMSIIAILRADRRLRK